MARLSALSVKPGDVAVADFPGVREVKRRPALVVSTAAYHQARPDVILAVLTGQIAAARDPTPRPIRPDQQQRRTYPRPDP